MLSEFLSQVKADYSWYSKSKNPFAFILICLRHPYFQLLLLFRILSNFAQNGGVKLCFCHCIYTTSFYLGFVK